MSFPSDSHRGNLAKDLLVVAEELGNRSFAWQCITSGHGKPLSPRCPRSPSLNMASKAARKQTQPVRRKRSRGDSQGGEPAAKRPREGDAVPTPGVIPIDTSGDVIFSIPRSLVGHTSKEDLLPIRLLLSAKVLSVASTAFAALLSPTYLEGQTLSSEDPPTIDFADDKGEPFYIPCSLLHHRKVVDAPTESELLDLVILADKYGCVATISSHVTLWLKPIMAAVEDSSDEFGCFVTGLMISYAIGDANRFRKVSKRLLTSEPNRSFAEEATSRSGAHLLPSSIWIHLAEQRMSMRTFVFSFLHRHANACGGVNTAAFKHKNIDLLLNCLPLPDSLDTLLFLLENDQGLEVQSVLVAMSDDLYDEAVISSDSRYFAFAEEICRLGDRLEGACIDCTREGSYNSKTSISCHHGICCLENKYGVYKPALYESDSD